MKDKNKFARVGFEDLPDVLEVKDLPKILPFSESHARLLVRRGDIPSRRFGRKHLILKKDLMALLNLKVG